MAHPQIVRHLISMLLIGCWLLVACANQNAPTEISQDPWGMVTVSAESPIRIAVAVSQQSELMGQESTEVIRGVELAIAEQDTIQGFAIEYVIFDGECSSAGGSEVARRILADTSIVGVIGPICSSACASAAPVLEEAHLTMVSPTCGASELTDQVGHVGSFLRAMYDDALEGGVAAEFAYEELAARRAVVVYDGGEDSLSMSNAFQTRFEDLGGMILGVETLPAGAADPSVCLAGSNLMDADIIYAPLLPDDAFGFLGYLDQSDQGGVPILGNRHLWSDAFADLAMPLQNAIYAAGPYPTGVRLEELNGSYVSQYGSLPPSAVHVYAYDATHLLLAALDEAGAIDSEGALQIGRQGFREVLYATSNFPAVSGTLTWTDWGECSTAHIAVGHMS